MRKVVITVCDEGSNSCWNECFDADDLVDYANSSTRRRKKGLSVETYEEAAEWGRGLITWFNDTRTPGEPARKLVSVKLIEEYDDA